MATDSSTTEIGDFAPHSSFARCLVPLLDVLGWKGGRQILFEALPPDANDMTLVELLNTLAHLKFESKSSYVDLRRMDPRSLPCLLVTDSETALCVIKSDGESLLVYEGESGTYTQIEPNLKGTGYFFRAMHPTQTSLLMRQPDWFAKALSRFWPVFGYCILISFILSVFAFATPLFVMTIYSQLNSSDSASVIALLGIGVAIFIIADAGFRLLRARLLSYTSVRLGNIVGNEVFRRIVFLPPVYTETASIDSQVNRMRDFEGVREFVAGPALTAVLDLPFTLILLLVLIVIGGSTAYVPLAAIGLFVCFGLLVTPVVRRTNAATAKSKSTRQNFVVEILSRLRDIKQTGSRASWGERHRALSAESALAGFASANAIAVVESLSHVFVVSAGVATMAVGAMNAMRGRMPTGALMASMMLVWRILAPLRSGFTVFTQLTSIKNSIKQLNRFMNMPFESKPESAMSIRRKIEGRIAFSQVSIRYSPEAQPALVGVSFAIDEGQTLVIAGHDGAGKSTILKLVLGLYTPQMGRIALGGANVRQIEPVRLRRSIGYVPQGSQVFLCTLGENIRLANPAASRAEIEAAARRAGIFDDIEALPDGFATRITRDTIAQFPQSFVKRIDLARLFVRDTNLWLLDEPEQAESQNGEDDLLAELQQAKGSKTTLLVTKQADYFEIADKMLWLDKGRVKMFGSAQEVGGAYAEYYTQ